MGKLLGFTDIEGTMLSQAGGNAAMLTELALAGFRIARGFVISSKDVGTMLMSAKVRSALLSYKQSLGSGDMEEAREHLYSTLRETRLPWEIEMEVVERLRELDRVVSLKLSTMSGKHFSPIHAHSPSSFINGVGKLVGNWLIKSPPGDIEKDVPAIMVQEIVDAESSIEVRRKQDGFDIRAIFGLPEGLRDPAISSDHYRFDGQLELIDSRGREQIWQHVANEEGTQRVDVLKDFREEPKLSREQLDSLIDIMSYMMEKNNLQGLQIAMLDDSPVIIDAMVEAEQLNLPLSLAQRKQSRSLIDIGDPSEGEEALPPLTRLMAESPVTEPSAAVTEPAISTPRKLSPRTEPIPTMTKTTRLILRASSEKEIANLPGQAQEVLLLGKWHGQQPPSQILEELCRTHSPASLIIQIRDDREWLEDVMGTATSLIKQGNRLGFMLPETRTLAEHHRIVKLLTWSMPDDLPTPEIWASFAYPTNLFFISEMSRGVDVISADLEALARHMGGHIEPSSDIRYEDHSMQEALMHLMDSAMKSRRQLAVHSPSFTRNPALLEILIRGGLRILAIDPSEISVVHPIISSLEDKIHSS